ncbi:MAG: 2'-5' RNA ligase family protein [Candidatus Peribacteraceae bacterium]
MGALLHFPLRSAFLALPLEGEAKWQFQALQEALRPFEESMRFQNPATPHLTLFFWPEVLELEYEGIVRQAEKIASAAQPFMLKVTNAATFGERGEDRTLYLEIALSPELALIKKSCPWSEGRPFKPHITLARIRHPQRFHVWKKKVMKAVEGAVFDIPIDRLRLYAEIEGRKQTPLEDFVFGMVG